MTRALPDLFDTASTLAAHRSRLLLAVLVACVALVMVDAVRVEIARRRHTRLQRNARWVEIRPGPSVDPRGAQLLWANLGGLQRPWPSRLLHGQPHLVFEYRWDDPAVSGGGLRLGFWVPGPIPPGLVEAAVHAAWPGTLTQVAAVPAFRGAGTVEGGRLRLARPDVLPLRTDHDVDPARALLAAGIALAAGESGCVQVLARPVTGRRVARARAAVTRPEGGSSAGLLLDAVTAVLREVLDIATPGGGARRPGSRTAPPDPAHTVRVRAALGKTTGPLWEAEARYAVTAPTREAARGRAHAVASAFAVHAGLNWAARHRLRRPDRALTERRLSRGDLLSVPELAALAHLPTDVDAPGITRAGARQVPAPPAVPAPGPNARPLGLTQAPAGREVGIGVEAARHHTHLLGATGSGKSTLIARMVLHDASHRRGAVVIDPKGDTVTEILDRLPDMSAGRLVVLDPAGPGPHPTLDLLYGGDPDVTVDQIVGIFARLYPGFWGPRTDDILRATLLTLLRSASVPSPSLVDVPRLLDDDGWRADITTALPITDRVLAGFWDWYERLSPAARAAATGPVMNKLRALLLRPSVTAVLAADPERRIDLTRVLDGGLLLVRLPQATLGPDTARLLGSFVLARAWQAATARSAVPVERRRDAAVYIDECHHFLTLPYPLDAMLAEARGLRVALTLAHQDLAQLPRDLREGISANARNKIVFACSPEDARALEPHVAPRLTAHDLANLGPYVAAARLLNGAATLPAFTLTTLPLPAPVAGTTRPRRFGHPDDGRLAVGEPVSALQVPAAGDPRRH